MAAGLALLGGSAGLAVAAVTPSNGSQQSHVARVTHDTQGIRSARKVSERPVLRVSRDRLRWTSVAGTSRYVLATMLPHSHASDELILGSRFMPAERPGRTVAYRVRANRPGARWSNAVSIRYGRIGSARIASAGNVAPVLTNTNGKLTWAAQSGASDFAGAVSTAARGAASRTTTYQDLGNTTTWTPTAQPGQTLYYGVASNGTAGQQWSTNEISIAWPATNTSPVLTVAAGKISWAAQVGVSDYTAATSTAPAGNANRTTTYQDLGNTTTWTPTTQPGQTLYYSIASNGPGGQKWATEISITWPTPNTAPQITLANNKITWTAQSGVTDYTGQTSTAATGGTTTSQDLGNTTTWTPTAQPGKTLYYSVSSNGTAGPKSSTTVSITWPAPTPPPSTTTNAPVLTVTNNKITWPAQTGVTDYTAATSTAPAGNANRTTTYQDLGNTTTWTPTAQPGQTLYYGIAANGPNGQQWATEVAITWPTTTPPVTPPPTTTTTNPPVLTVTNNKITWPAQTGVTDYTAATSTAPAGNANRTTTYQDLGNTTTWTPTAQPGQTLYYGIAANGPNSQQWATEVAITWPAAGGGSSSGGGSSAPVSLSNPPSGEQTAPLGGGRYGLKLNEWNSGQPITMTSDGGADFNVTSSGLNLATGGAPSGYFELWQGSSWGANTNNNGAPFPIQTSSITPGEVTTSATCHTAGVTGDWDNSYDIWFNSAQGAGQTNNSAGNHLEMMIWLNHTAGADPIGTVVANNVTIGGNTYNVWYGGDNTVSYVLSQPSTTISTDLYPMIRDAESRGYMQSSWYLLDVEFGFEIWNGGAGLGCSSFAVNA